ncbi:hypothetical protein RQM47_14810 [Rubrivirga sp. S365]|uniref:Lipoprotein n=1 Tax=Rubrivirga litoralis TaxID=3075598 RepID=A0ABU3BRE5_9BACT|nr:MULTISPECIES: hypothetical protein [unclassified Rubrivirga]MDT0631861.1 hypothetical protein [Rubrivirga sp. F394]MDT7857914.1 hypothetical protein [Rubrivirga sp. S365]
MRRPALAAVLLVAAGCDSNGAPVSDAELLTDARAYRAQVTSSAVTFEAGLTYTNASDETVYFTGCQLPESPVLEKRVGSEWVVAVNPVYLLCLSQPLAVAPGESVDYVAGFHGCTGDRCAPEWLPGPAPETVPGTYRLVTAVATAVEGGLPAESRAVVSNEFRVDVAGGLR